MGNSAIGEFETLKGLVTAGRNRDGTALNIVRRPTPYSYHKLCTNVWKAGNLLGHYGVHAVGELSVGVGPKSVDESDANSLSHREGEGSLDAAEPLLAVLGGSIIGATVDLTPTEPVDAPALVAPAHWDIEVTASCSRLAYGGPPTDPDVSHFERDVWSENPIEPPENVTPDQEALRFEGESWTHEELLTAMRASTEQYGIDSETTVLLRTSVLEPGVFLAGILAPLAVGATIVVPEKSGDSEDTNTEALTENGDGRSIAVTRETTGENRISGVDVTRSMRDTRRA